MVIVVCDTEGCKHFFAYSSSGGGMNANTIVNCNPGYAQGQQRKLYNHATLSLQFRRVTVTSCPDNSA